MCLIGVALDLPGPWLFVLAANRDEFHDRHCAPAAVWDEAAGGLLAGRDLQGGGTWLGLRAAADRSTRIAALTNLRPGLMPVAHADQMAEPVAVPPSRGQLVTDFLRADETPATFITGLDPPAGAYAGFNLLALRLVGFGAAVACNSEDATAAHGSAGAAKAAVDAWYLNNLPDARPQRLAAGLHTVSNATLDVAWPKTEKLRAAFAKALVAGSLQGLTDRLFDALSDRSPAADRDLPGTGLDPARERLLSAPFIVDDHYGTRCSTVIAVTRAGEAIFVERSFGPGGAPHGTVTYSGGIFSKPWMRRRRSSGMGSGLPSRA